MERFKQWAAARLAKWLEPELFQPFVFGVLVSLTLSEFVRGALTLSMIPTYGRSVLGFAVEWTALALSVHYLTDNVLRSPAGWLTDRLGQRTALLAGFAVAAVAVVWMMTTRSFGGLLASLALFGVGVTPVWPSAVSGIGIATPEKSRAVFMGYVYIFWLAGTGLGPVLINLVAGGTYRLAFAILIGVELLAFLLAWRLVRAPQTARSDPAKGRQHTRLRLDRSYLRSLWRNVKEVAFLFPGMFAQTFAVASLIPILSLYARTVLGISGALYSAMLVFGGAFTVLLLIPAGKLVDRFGPRPFLVTGFLAASSALGVYPFVHDLVATFITVGVLGTCYAFILPAWNSVLDRSIDPDKKGTLWGVFMTVEGLGSAAGPYIGGLVWDTISPKAPFWVSAAVIFIMGLLYIVLPLQVARPFRERAAARQRRPARRQRA